MSLRRSRGAAPIGSRRRGRLRAPLIVLALGLVGIAGAYIASRDAALRPWQAVLGQPAAILSVGAFMTCIGQFAPFLFSAGSRLFRRAHTPARLAWANLVGEGWRSASMVLAAGSAVAAAFMISSLGRMVLGSIQNETSRTTSGSVIVTTIPLSNAPNLEAKPSPHLVSELKRIPGVARVRRAFHTGIATSARGNFAAEAYEDRAPTYSVIRGRSDPTAFARGEVVIGPGLARRDGIRPGDELSIPGRNGLVRVRVQGIVENGDTTGLEITMPVALLERIWGPQPPLSLTVDPGPGVSPAELARRIEGARLDPHLNALAEPEYIADVARETNRFFAPFWALQRALVVIAFAAVLSNLLLVALRRGRELGLVAAVGMAPRELGLMVVTEALAVGVVAVLLGSLAALGATEAFRQVLYIMIPYPMPFRLDPAAPFVYGAITMAVLLVAASWPAWRTSRLNVVEALRYE